MLLAGSQSGDGITEGRGRDGPAVGGVTPPVQDLGLQLPLSVGTLSRRASRDGLVAGVLGYRRRGAHILEPEPGAGRRTGCLHGLVGERGPVVDRVQRHGMLLDPRGIRDPIAHGRASLRLRVCRNDDDQTQLRKLPATNIMARITRIGSLSIEAQS